MEAASHQHSHPYTTGIFFLPSLPGSFDVKITGQHLSILHLFACRATAASYLTRPHFSSSLSLTAQVKLHPKPAEPSSQTEEAYLGHWNIYHSSKYLLNQRKKLLTIPNITQEMTLVYYSSTGTSRNQRSLSCLRKHGQPYQSFC